MGHEHSNCGKCTCRPSAAEAELQQIIEDAETCTCRPSDPCYFHKHKTHDPDPTTGICRTVLTGDPGIDTFLWEAFDTMRAKGEDYRQGNPDLLAAFRKTGEELDLPMEKVWAVFVGKHQKAIGNFVRTGGQSESEPIEGRIKDVIVYHLLFWKMVQEMKDDAIELSIGERPSAGKIRLDKVRTQELAGLRDVDTKRDAAKRAAKQERAEERVAGLSPKWAEINKACEQNTPGATLDPMFVNEIANAYTPAKNESTDCKLSIRPASVE